MQLFVTRPNHDDETDFISQWFSHILAYCESKSHSVLDLEGSKANRKQVESVLGRNSPNLIVFNGHGTNDSIKGHQDEIIIKSNDNEKILKNKIVYALACNAAAKLGADCIANGTKAFIGYGLPFLLLSDPNKGFAPLEDKFLKPVLESSNELVISLIKGNTVDESYKRSQDSFEKWIQKLQRSNSDYELQHLLPVLYWNKSAQKVIGNGSITVNS